MGCSFGIEIRWWGVGSGGLRCDVGGALPFGSRLNGGPFGGGCAVGFEIFVTLVLFVVSSFAGLISTSVATPRLATPFARTMMGGGFGSRGWHSWLPAGIPFRDWFGGEVFAWLVGVRVVSAEYILRCWRGGVFVATAFLCWTFGRTRNRTVL